MIYGLKGYPFLLRCPGNQELYPHLPLGQLSLRLKSRVLCFRGGTGYMTALRWVITFASDRHILQTLRPWTTHHKPPNTDPHGNSQTTNHWPSWPPITHLHRASQQGHISVMHPGPCPLEDKCMMGKT